MVKCFQNGGGAGNGAVGNSSGGRGIVVMARREDRNFDCMSQLEDGYFRGVPVLTCQLEW